MAVAIVQRRQDRRREGYGVRNWVHPTPVDERHHVWDWVEYKAFTTAALAGLVDAASSRWTIPVYQPASRFS